MQRFVALIAACTVGLTGCEHMNNTEKGALVGTGMGAVAGTAIGAATGNPRTGAALGALGGALVGTAAGSAEDQREKDSQIRQAVNERDAATANASRLGLIDIVTLSQQGTDPDVIVNQIQATNSTFQLSTADIQYLTQQQVPAKVIRAMQESASRRVAVPRERVIIREEPVYIERPYHGPRWYGPPMGFGVSYVRVR